MRRMVFLAPGKLEWREAPDPEIEGPDEAIVSPTVMGRCDLDALYLAGRVPMAAGEPIGHEIIGTVVDLGETAARRFRIGQTVIVTAQIACGRCGRCLGGLTGRCENVPFGASYGMGRLLGLPHLAQATRDQVASLPERLLPRARHVVSEVARVDAFVESLRADQAPS